MIPIRCVMGAVSPEGQRSVGDGWGYVPRKQSEEPTVLTRPLARVGEVASLLPVAVAVAVEVVEVAEVAAVEVAAEVAEALLGV